MVQEIAELDILAEYAGLNLWVEHNEENPSPFAVFADLEDGISELIGSGDSESEAIEAARVTIRGWEEVGIKALEGNQR